MTMTTIRGMFELLRFELSFSAAVAVLAGEVLALGAIPAPAPMIAGCLSIFFLAATALILNDCFDVETDRINAPSRPIPSGRVTKTGALGLAAGTAVLGLTLSALLGLEALILACAIWCVGVLYNWRLKRTGVAGNLAVATSVGMTFIYGAVVVGNLTEPVVWYMAVTTFLIDLGEEIAADALDVRGDGATGSSSLAVRHGPEKAMTVAVAIFGVVVAGSALPFVAGWFTWRYLPVMALWDLVVIFSMVNLLKAGRPERLRDVRRIYLSGLAMMCSVILLRIVTP